MKRKYRYIELNSVAKYTLAERLVANGWKIIQSSPWSLLLEKRTLTQR